MKTSHLLISFILSFCIGVLSCKKDDPKKDPINESTLKGVVVVDHVHSDGLESNLLADNPERKVSVYLPPAYESDTEKSYPVLYLLHAYMCDHDTWFGGTSSEYYGDNGLNMKKMLDTLIQNDHIEAMIIVCPSSNNSYEGSWYTNSSVSGNWEDFIVDDVVGHIDSNYRTLPFPESRGIAGHSMGSYGSMKLAMKHPDVFSSVFSMSGSGLSIGTMMEVWKDHIVAASRETSYNRFGELRVKIAISMSVAMAPNPANAPFMGEFPYQEDGTPIDSTWQKWLDHDPVSLLDQYTENMKQLKTIHFECGTEDDAILANSTFSDALTTKGIEHVFESYSGGHENKVPERIASLLLPFFSDNLEQDKD